MDKDTEAYDIEIKLDADGQIDHEYYYRKADELRAEYIAAIFHSAKNDIKSLLVSFYEKFLCIKCQPSH